jgi:hypothetical protein
MILNNSLVYAESLPPSALPSALVGLLVGGLRHSPGEVIGAAGVM